ncbi:ribosomal RNA small subunit methyltransferase E [Burkholderiales bacterium GJ-E10]|nr:ribosomal RNA small subunit methyltransferase E [Burkholderiales bacterium GJ-E10]
MLRPHRLPIAPGTYVPGDVVTLSDGASRHARVLRLGTDEPFVLFDGAGQEYGARLEAVVESRRHSGPLAVRILSAGAVDREARVEITLIQALAAQEKLEWTIEKAVELGVRRILLAPAQRSVVRLDGARQERRAERWREIAWAACAQCGRNRIPEVAPAASLEAALRAAADAQCRWILDPDGTAGLGAAPIATVSCAIGPEGGFTEEETALAERLGYRRLRLGPRVLRTETAGIAVVSALLALGGEYS